MVKNAINSVLVQTYQDFEVIIVDVGLEKRADKVVSNFDDPRLTYLKIGEEKNGSAARNIGIKNSNGKFIAFLDDDDEWLPEKLEIQMRGFENTPNDVGFCFSAVKNVYDDGREELSKIPDGIADYHELALDSFNKFLTVTLIIKRFVFNKTGVFDENFPSHQEAELMIRITKEFKGCGINMPLVNVNMAANHGQVGSNIKKKIAGREMILKKHLDEFRQHPKTLAQNYFQVGIWNRDNGDKKKAVEYFKKSWQTSFNLRYLAHFIKTGLFNL